ncbi:MAG: hypothetical protein JST68_22485 [Bacteroidetes bacterium]|nr:hypothetical protein [Bacteroidota bacterium]
MKVAETSTTTATPAKTSTTGTPFFAQTKGENSFFGGETDQDSADKDHFFQRTPTIQAKPDAPSTPTPGLAATSAPAPTSVPAPATAPTTSPTAVTIPPEVIAIRSQAKIDAKKIKNILTDNSWLTGGDQSKIMAIIWQWTIKIPIVGHRLSPFDYLIIALQGETFTIGTLVSQWTNAFDQIMHRMDDDNVTTFNMWMKYFAKQFNDEKAHEEVKFEIKKEHIVQGLETVGDVAAAGAELAAAGLTGGASELAILAKWLVDTLPELYSSAKTIVGVIDTIRSLKKEDLQKLFSPAGMGNVLVKSLFGEIQGLPIPAGEEEKEEKDTGGGRGERGFMKVLSTIKRVITGLVSAYRKLAGHVNSTLSALDLTKKDWFNGFSMAYAGIMNTIEAATDPGGAIDKATGALREITSGFFENVKGKLDEVVASIKDRLQAVTQPAVILKKIADSAVEWVLNFIITHPPSRLFKLLGKLVTAISGKSIVELLREKVSFADDIIKKIADSGPVQKLVTPLHAPINGITSIVDSIAGKAGAFIGSMETRVLSFMNNGEAFLKEMVGAKDHPAGTATGSAAATETQPTPTDAIGTIRAGIHSRLMTIGGRLLIEKGKQLGAAAVEKGKTAALDWWNKKVKFKSVDDQNHTLFFSGQGKDSQLMVATTPIPVNDLMTQLQNKPEIRDKNSVHHIAYEKALKLVADATKLVAKVQNTGAKGYDYKDIDKLNPLLEKLSDTLQILIPLVYTPPQIKKTDVSIGSLFKRTTDQKLYIVKGFEAKTDLVNLVKVRKSNDGLTQTFLLITKFVAEVNAGEWTLASDRSKREEYMGKLDETTKAKVRKAVIDRMAFMGKFKRETNEYFNSRPPNVGWYPEPEADLGHIVDAATWWNAHGRFTGAQSPQVKQFMEDPANYELEEPTQNRKRGTQVENYMPPVNL